MSKIQITDLQPIGSELFQSAESFLTELKPTEAHNIFGGSNKGRKGSGKGSSNGSGSSNGRRRRYSYNPCPCPVKHC
jgi:hypothetical protein